VGGFPAGRAELDDATCGLAGPSLLLLIER
jgi:hypothetical protein